MEIIHIKSQLLFLFFSLIFQLTRTLASPTDELILARGHIGEIAVEDNTASSYSKARGYECGNTFFYEPEVQEALQAGLHRFYNKYETERYLGPLYSDSESSEYLLFSFKKKGGSSSSNKYKPCSAFVVFKRDDKKVIDVITRISNNHFTKCIKRDGSRTESSISVFDNTNGYQCGHEFIGDHIIQESRKMAKSKIGKNTKYPVPYFGNLFPEDSGYLIWPIFYRRLLHISSNSNSILYNLIISKDGDLIDVVVKGYFENFLRCTRTRKTTAPKSDPLTKLFVPAPIAGFQCGKIFFSNEALDKAAKTAEMVFFKKKSHFRPPSPYIGDPFNEPCWLWPIFNNGLLYRKGWAGLFRVVLTLDFKVKSAVIVNKDNKLTVCEHKIKARKNHDTSDYFCGNIRLSNALLVNAAETGCDRIGTETSKNNRFFPARYKGPRFEKDGPYLTYPVFLNGKPYDGKAKKPGRFRVVLNHSCEVVGAIFSTESEEFGKDFSKCYRIGEDESIEESIDDTNEPIIEYKFTY